MWQHVELVGGEAIVAQQETPIVYQLRLRAELRKLRDAANFTQKQAAERLEWSISKMIRIEGGMSNVSFTDLKALLALYGVDDPERVEDLAVLAREGRKSAWWTKYRKSLDPQLFMLIGYEASATRIRQFQSQMLPGLLQTSGYVEALARHIRLSQDAVELGVVIREQRRRIMVEDGPDMHFVLDEAIVQRSFGDLASTLGQLRRLREVALLPNVDLRILPFSSGLHPGLQKSFTVLEVPPDGDHVLVFEEEFKDFVIRESDEESTEYLQRFEEIVQLSLDPEESLGLLDELIAKCPAD